MPADISVPGEPVATLLDPAGGAEPDMPSDPRSPEQPTAETSNEASITLDERGARCEWKAFQPGRDLDEATLPGLARIPRVGDDMHVHVSTPRIWTSNLGLHRLLRADLESLDTQRCHALGRGCEDNKGGALDGEARFGAASTPRRTSDRARSDESAIRQLNGALGEADLSFEMFEGAHWCIFLLGCSCSPCNYRPNSVIERSSGGVPALLFSLSSAWSLMTATR
jgi:hypothetical protein